MLSTIFKPFLRFDRLGAEVPKFNIGGEESLRTYTGGVLSFIIMNASLLFAILKL